ncbi:MAG: Holliday junction branch migration protein RuvA [Candidatus Aureabacteria bacterium]|nr:Holliday junction branch migration protein RuvA [Candidatus Auribacterota bacterium]
MIGYLKGRIIKIDPVGVLLDVNGVGYEVKITLGTYEGISRSSHQNRASGGDVELYVCTVVREDDISLYGFSTLQEKNLFKLLVSVSGIGPKVAISVLNGVTPAVLLSALKTGNASVLSSIHGVGQKTAERMIVELKGKAGKIDYFENRNIGKGPVDSAEQNLLTDAVNAMISLGFESKSAVKAVESAYRKAGADATLEDILRESLKEKK